MKKMYYWFIPIVILMIIGTFFDLQISQWQDKINQNFLIHGYYRFFEIFGEFAYPLIYVTVFAFFCNFGFRKTGPIKWLQILLNGIGLLFFSIMEFMSFARYLVPSGGNSNGEISQTMVICSIILGLILAYMMFRLMNNIKYNDYKYYRKVAIMSIIYIIILTFVIQFVKITWARPRY